MILMTSESMIFIVHSDICMHIFRPFSAPYNKKKIFVQQLSLSTVQQA